MMFVDTASPVRLVFDDGYGLSIDAFRMSQNWWRCEHSSHPMEDQMIYWGDWIQVKERSQNCFEIVRVVARTDLFHLFCDQGIFLYGGPPEKQQCTQHPADPGKVSMQWLHEQNTHLEWECFFGLSDGVTLHLPLERQTELINGIEQQHSYSLNSPFIGLTGQCGAWANC